MDDVFEENDTLQSATAYGLYAYERDCLCGSGYYGSCYNYCAVQNDEDWYEIYWESGGVDFYVDCYFSHAGGNIDLEVYNGAGVLLGGSYSSTDNESISLFNENPFGTYYIRVFGSDAGNAYDLSFLVD